MKNPRRKISILAALALTSLVLLHGAMERRLVDYLTWRWMVTFKRPIERVDDYKVVVIKSAHRLEVYYEDSLIDSYRVGLSQRGLGPRETWADELTPEGKFLIASMQRQSVFGPRQMLLDTSAQSLADYLEEHGEKGRVRLADWEAKHGALNSIWEVYDFNEAHPEQPIWNDILIHGGGSGRDWTLGCIALDDADLVELFDTLYQSRRRGLGVVVEIKP